MPPASRSPSRDPFCPRPARSTRAFSLVELLTVLTVIGMFVAIMVPVISGMSRDADETCHRRNAQSIASVFVAGEAAGARFLVPGDIHATVEKIAQGVVIEHGVFAGHLFSVPGLSDEDQAAALTYLRLEGHRLVYEP